MISRFALGSLAVCLALLLLLLIAIPNFSDWLARPFIGGFTVGHALVTVIHVLPVVAAWVYLGRRERDES